VVHEEIQVLMGGGIGSVPVPLLCPPEVSVFGT